jgi:hypothetical protein
MGFIIVNDGIQFLFTQGKRGKEKGWPVLALFLNGSAVARVILAQNFNQNI